jgi:hypothetical protein
MKIALIKTKPKTKLSSSNQQQPTQEENRETETAERAEKSK